MERNRIVLTAKKRAELEKFSRTGVHSVRLVNRAKIILALDTSAGRTAETDEAIAEQIGVSRRSLYTVKRDYLAAGNVSDFLQRKKRETPPVPPKVTGELEARIIAIACSEAPPGCKKWSLRLIAEKCVELQYCSGMSHMTVSRLLKKHSLSLT
jgi:hypothetical protein